ncbi:MAG: histone deacetylase family protein, partial [Pseudomonadota bacterium]|nr:histone deacetylase family protein [Pseudomonadota bacterium]
MRIYTHPEYLNHQVMDGHPERPERLSHLMKHLSQIGLTQDFEVVQPQPVPTSRILAAHSQSYVDFLRGTSPEEGIVPLDPDTWMSPA